MGKVPEVRYCPHHLSHATASYYSSGFNDAAILSIDGHGDEHTTVLWHAVDDEIIPIKEFKVPNSIGWFYAALTEYLGFESNSGEGKLMGLAPYGRENKKIESIFDKILKIKEDGYDLNQCFIFYGKHSYNPRFTDKLVDELGKPRNKNNKISEKHKNIAYSTQNKLENVMVRLSDIIKNKTSSENLCISGGVGLNCKANQKIRENGIFKEIFIHPAPHEPSAAIGSSFLLYKELTGKIANNKIEHAYLGPSYSNDKIEESLILNDIRYEKLDSYQLPRLAAEEISEGKIIGWFQGRMEFGPRALGNRSILADPQNKKNKDKVNIIKGREAWRPLAPTIIDERKDEYLENAVEAPFMIMSFNAKPDKYKDIPAVVHVDGTTRPQTLKKEINPKYYNLIQEFDKITGVPLVLNTSFNMSHEPIVCSPDDAIKCFRDSNLDSMFIGDFFISKYETEE